MYSRKTEVVRRGKGLSTVVSGKEKVPADDEDAASGKFQEEKDQALSHIILTIDDAICATVFGLKDPLKVWQKLQAIYQVVSATSVDVFLTQY